MKYKKYIMEDVLDEIIDYRGKTPKKSEIGIPTLSAKSVKNGYIDYSNCYYISQEEYKRFMIRGLPKKGDILLTTEAPMGLVAKLDRDDIGIAQRLLTLRGNPKIIDNDYLLYWLQSDLGQVALKAKETGTTVTGIKQSEFRKIQINLPDVKIQKRVSSILCIIDKKISFNNKINNNLEQQAFVIFDNMFPDVSTGSNLIGNIITPQRGKNLLSKDAIPGEVPVVAGGLEPATYHNASNTVSPVLTISASGANAGYVNLWNVPVWSSDSSFIDVTMTDDVYFWYVMLKKRQKEIFDAQTGSAQPHIYPKHIAAMPVAKLEQKDITQFTNLVTPLFCAIGENKQENIKLAELRDYLLPKLMSGELDVSDIDL
ncbi:restriction endonuclease subunit S [Amedibacterium intestinale]|uniref:restriction endonuclease subunit S n=1 Tax=Amedibacterium intestinale TaxID=2583452 RepID=UPI0018E574A6